MRRAAEYIDTETTR